MVSMDSVQRIKTISDAVKDDAKALRLISAVYQAALRYVSAVYEMETALSRIRISGESGLKEATATMDQARTLAHNSLIDSIRICNRYLFTTYGSDKIPVGGVYSSDPVHLSDDRYRAAIGDWAGSLVLSVFSSRFR